VGQRRRNQRKSRPIKERNKRERIDTKTRNNGRLNTNNITDNNGGYHGSLDVHCKEE
tara:strand:+ start:491 stop:661 length:171 start_codon:yes stop_codon:yes gene_type:complete